MKVDLTKTSYSKQDILRYCLHDPATKVRLPAPPLLMFDRITQIETEGGRFGKGVIEAEFDIRSDLWFFLCHFQGDPVMPGVLQLDAILQLSGFFLVHMGNDGHGRALRTGKVHFKEQVRPHNKLVTYHIDIRKVSSRPAPLVFAEAYVDVDGERSVEVGGIMCGVFPDMTYEYP